MKLKLPILFLSIFFVFDCAQNSLLLEAKVYEIEEVDKEPSLENGEPLPKKISYYRKHFSYGEPQMNGNVLLSFVITKEGFTKNIKQNSGLIDLKYFPDLRMELLTEIKKLGRLKPAFFKNKAVDVLFTIDFDLMV